MPTRPSTSRLPLTATRPELLPGRSDHSFRELLSNLLTLAGRLEAIRRNLGARIGVSGPQYSLLMAVAELQGTDGISVNRVAKYLHVNGTFVTAEAGKLVKKRFLKKSADPTDGRVSRLSLGERGWAALESLFPELPQVNDSLFDLDSRQEFEALCATIRRLVANSHRTLALLEASAELTGDRS